MELNQHYISRPLVWTKDRGLNPKPGYENLKPKYRENFGSGIGMIKRAEFTVSGYIKGCIWNILSFLYLASQF